jgi:Alkylmercury lyase
MAGGSDAPRALEAAGMARGRWGEGRMARLTDAERELYRWILRTFAAGAPPSVEALCDTASELDLDVEEALATLAREDLVHHDPRSGNVVVAYPFSGRPTSHRVRIGAAIEVHAMCAIDALGIPFMVGTGAEVASLDPVTGEEVWLRVEPGDGSWWEPNDAVVVAAAKREAGPSASTCCRFVNFFASPESAGRYLREHPELQGEVVSIAEAIEAGRLVFGEVLEGAR